MSMMRAMMRSPMLAGVWSSITNCPVNMSAVAMLQEKRVVIIFVCKFYRLPFANIRKSDYICDIFAKILSAKDKIRL